MVWIGIIGIVGIIILCIVVAGLTVWGGWRAMRDELGRNFRSSRAGPRALSLTLIGVIIPVVAITVFLLGLVFWLLRLIVQIVG